MQEITKHVSFLLKEAASWILWSSHYSTPKFAISTPNSIWAEKSPHNCVHTLAGCCDYYILNNTWYNVRLPLPKKHTKNHVTSSACMETHCSLVASCPNTYTANTTRLLFTVRMRIILNYTYWLNHLRGPSFHCLLVLPCPLVAEKIHCDNFFLLVDSDKVSTLFWNRIIGLYSGRITYHLVSRVCAFK